LDERLIIRVAIPFRKDNGILRLVLYMVWIGVDDEDFLEVSIEIRKIL